MEIPIKNSLRIYKTQEDYNNVKCSLDEPIIASIDDTELIYYHPTNGDEIYAKYNITNITSTTKILGSSFDITQISKILIDDVEIDNVGTSYTFTTSGEHNVTYVCSCNGVTNCSNMFNGCNKMIDIDFSNFNTSKVTNMSNMFYSCTALTSLDLSNFDTSKVTNMSNMFYGCSDGGGSGLSTLILSDNFGSSCEDMSYMFNQSRELSSSDFVKKLDTSKCKNMKYMFSYVTGITEWDLTTMNTSACTDMSSMFFACWKARTYTFGDNWDTSNVTNMSDMFGQNTWYLKHVDLSKFNTSACTNISGMFNFSNRLTRITFGDKWDTSNVTDMGYFIGSTDIVTFDLSNFDTSKCANLRGIFSNCDLLTTVTFPNNFGSVSTNFDNFFYNCSAITSVDMSNWNTSAATSFYYMFSDCTALTEVNIGSIDLTNLTDVTSMFGDITTNGTLKHANQTNVDLIINVLPSTWTNTTT